MSYVSALPPSAASPRTEPSAPTTPKQLLRVAGEFEAVLLAQMLRSSGVEKSCGEQTYRGMIIDAMATAVTQAGGLGLAKHVAGMVAEGQARSAGAKAPQGVPK